MVHGNFTTLCFLFTEFDDYFLKLGLPHQAVDPWFKEYWESIFECSFTWKPNTSLCTGKEDIKAFNNEHYEQEGLVQFVIDSVYALAHAIDSIRSTKCPTDAKACLRRSYLNGEDVLNNIRNVSFKGIGGDAVEFDDKGDGLGRYDIFQYQRLPHDRYEYVRVGEWTDRLVIFNDTLKFRSGSDSPPRSVCSEECPFGYIKNNTVESDTCCWVCIRCRENQMLINEFTCQDCPDGYTPNQNLTSCIPLPIEITSLCMCVSISATVALVCLFGPKVYIVIFQPHKNVRQGATPSLQTASRSFPKPFIPDPSNQTAICSKPTLTSYESNNGHVGGVTKVVDNVHTTASTIETINDMFSDSLEDEEEEEFCDETSFIPKPTEDKATSTSEQ
ncbi:Metabotropic glutamate receptor 1 [Mactra antiquata]